MQSKVIEMSLLMAITVMNNGITSLLELYLGQGRPALYVAVGALVLMVALSPLLWTVIVRTPRQQQTLQRLPSASLLARVESKQGIVSAELVNGLGEHLTILLSRLRRLQKRARDLEVERQIDECRGLAEFALTSVRQIARRLRPSMLDDLGLGAAVENLVEEANQNRGESISLEMSSEFANQRYSDPIAMAAFCIVREGVGNIIRHSGAKQGYVRLSCSEGGMKIEIEDDGAGMTPHVCKTALVGDGGLREIELRAQAAGGSFRLQSTPGQGTRLHVRLPLEESSIE